MKRINYYTSVLDLFDEYGLELSEDQKAVIDGATCWEPLAWAVIDGQQVITLDSFNGDVLGTDSLEGFYKESLDYASAELN